MTRPPPSSPLFPHPPFFPPPPATRVGSRLSGSRQMGGWLPHRGDGSPDGPQAPRRSAARHGAGQDRGPSFQRRRSPRLERLLVCLEATLRPKRRRMATSLFLEQTTQETDRLGRLTSGHMVTLTARRRRDRISRSRGGDRQSAVGLPPEEGMETKGGEALPEVVAESVTPPWRVLWTSSNCEQLVYSQLAAKGFDMFLPTVETWCRRGGGRPLSRIPMFGGHLFLRPPLDQASYLEAYNTRGLVGIPTERWDRPHD